MSKPPDTDHAGGDATSTIPTMESTTEVRHRGKRGFTPSAFAKALRTEPLSPVN